ncbi:MAG: hypothetical protein HQK88_10810 [Nitrospirae bacterium]|nr:hypothetical protein [Nitrospirota bacterium]MBF0535287.1 hypothetical protein [Nitrospirota bacterium]MBF0617290.1 hypothetical protein [Nitrospirota bacterium]
MYKDIFIIALPMAAALLCIVLRSSKADRFALIVVSLINLAVSLTLPYDGVYRNGELLGTDTLGFIFLFIVNISFLGSAVYSNLYLKEMDEAQLYDHWYAPAMIFLLSVVTGAVLSRNLALMWLFVGAVPLAAATLIWHHRDKESLEAAWKHLFICSVGIVLSFIGVLSMIEASDYVLGHNLSIDTLANYSSVISPLWGGMAFTFALVGYGALMGLSPMHTWLPDAHSKAPSPASALFSGTLQASAFLAILRYYQILSATLMIPFIRGLLLTLGLISLLTGAVFIPRVDNFRRKLAYSTVAHMGVLATALGLGGFAIYAAILHTLCHSLLKHTLFLTSGNFLYTYGTIKTSGICRGMRRIPQSSVTLVAAALFITGIPTSGIFVSELIIIKQMVTDSRWITLAVFTVLSATAAYGLMKSVFQMVLSKRPSDSTASVCDENAEAVKEPVLSLLPQWVFLLIILILGISIPFELNWLLHGAAYILGGY